MQVINTTSLASITHLDNESTGYCQEPKRSMKGAESGVVHHSLGELGIVALI